MSALSDLSPPPELRNVGRRGFESVGALWRRLLEEFGLRPDHRVLDAGCGVGRIAIPLTGYITTGSYEGFDVSRPMLEWCQQNITPRFPNFRFEHADIYNGQYNPEGRYKASEYRFPYDDESFDFVFLTSVFTHMLPADVDHYLSEIARVMRGGALCVITYFLLNERTRRGIAEGRTRRSFSYKGKGYRYDRPQPEAAIAYDEKDVRAMYTRHGLEIESVFEGRWAGSADREHQQDVVVARKP